MKLGEIFPSKFLKVDDLDGDVPVIISKLEFERMKDDDGKEEEKPVLYFLRVDKGLVLNKTNATTISEQHGDETDAWVGKRITLTRESVTAFGKKQWAIRVKAIPPPSSASGSKAFKSAQTEPAPEPAAAPAGDPADTFS